MTKLRTIKIRTQDGRDLKVKALIIGGLAVHPSTYVPEGASEGWAVTDLHTGGAIACFTVHHVALNFANRLHNWYDFAPLAKAMVDGNLTDNQKQIANEIGNMRKHATFYLPPVEAYYGDQKP